MFSWSPFRWKSCSCGLNTLQQRRGVVSYERYFWCNWYLKFSDSRRWQSSSSEDEVFPELCWVPRGGGVSKLSWVGKAKMCLALCIWAGISEVFPSLPSGRTLRLAATAHGVARGLSAAALVWDENPWSPPFGKVVFSFGLFSLFSPTSKLWDLARPC